MKRVLSLFAILVLVFGCEEENTEEPIPFLEENDGSIVLITNQSTSTFDLSDESEEFVSFDIDIDLAVKRAVSSVNVQMIFTDELAYAVPVYVEDDDRFSVSQTFELMEVTTFPTRVSLSVSDVLSALPEFSDVGDFFGGDLVELIFQVNTTDGRTLLNSEELDLCEQTNRTSTSNCKVLVNIECPLSLQDVAGNYLLVEDGFPASLAPDEPIVAVAGPGENEFTFINMFNHSTVFEYTITIDPQTSEVEAPGQYAFDTAELIGTIVAQDMGIAQLHGYGLFNACSGDVTLYLRGSSNNPDNGIFADWGHHRYVLKRISE